MRSIQTWDARRPTSDRWPPRIHFAVVTPRTSSGFARARHAKGRDLVRRLNREDVVIRGGEDPANLRVLVVAGRSWDALTVIANPDRSPRTLRHQRHHMLPVIPKDEIPFPARATGDDLQRVNRTGIVLHNRHQRLVTRDSEAARQRCDRGSRHSIPDRQFRASMSMKGHDLFEADPFRLPHQFLPPNPEHSSGVMCQKSCNVSLTLSP